MEKRTKGTNKRVSVGFVVLCIAVAIYAVILTRETVRVGSVFNGEAASYTLTTVSLANDGNAIVSEDDLAKAREWMPAWADHYITFGGSGYTTDQGTVPWYFPTYPAACLPMFGLLALLKLPMQYAFCMTNLLCLLVVQLVVLLDRRLTLMQKAPLCLLLAIHPVVFYIDWPSAEVFQFALIALSALCWATGRRHRAAILIAVAGTTNPCILAIGLAMIAEYLVGLWKSEKGGPVARIKGMILRWKEVLVYACCYVVGLVPFAYNYSICGGINLTASHASEWIPLNDWTLLRHFWAYFTDWNFGMLPYMPLLLAIWIVLLVIAAVRRCGRYLWMSLGFAGALLGVSLMSNINHGMAGTSRYLSWSTAMMVVAICTQATQMLRGLNARRVLAGAMVCSAAYTGAVILAYGGIDAPETSYLQITPIAQKLVEHFPSLYQPLPVVLTMRSNMQLDFPDGWTDDDGDFRKLYINQTQADLVRDSVSSHSAEDLAWLEDQLNKLDEDNEILTFPAKRHIYRSKWNFTIENGGFFVSAAEVQDDMIITGPGAGYPFWTEATEYAAGAYQVRLKADVVQMPTDAPAQLQAARNTEAGLEILAAIPLEADGTAVLTFELPTRMDGINFRVYQNDGTVLQIKNLEMERLY